MKIEPSSSEQENQAFTAALRQILGASTANVQSAIAAAKAEKFSNQTKYSPVPVKAS